MAQPVRALVVINVQNEFLSRRGNFPCPEQSTEPLIENLSALIPQFRASRGQIIWVNAIYEDRTEQPAKNLKDVTKGSDEWLTNATHVYEISCCKKDTFGSKVHPDLWVHADLEKDKVVEKGFYSAFKRATALLEQLEKKAISDAYFCGIASGTCVLASVLDAAKHKDKFNTHVVTDCLGYRRLSNHEESIERMKRLPDVELVDSDDVEWIQYGKQK